MDMPDESADAVAPVAKSKKKLFVVLGLLVVLLGGGGAAAWFLMSGSDTPKEAKAAPAKVPFYLALETFTVNLQGEGQYLQTDITLQVSSQAQVDAIKLHMPRVRSRLLTLLSTQDAEMLNTPEGKALLTQAIIEQVNQPFDPKSSPQQVDDVLFTSFVIQ